MSLSQPQNTQFPEADCRECPDGALAGRRDSRLHLLSLWRDAPCYTERERAALRWCEEVTLVAETHASEAAYTDLSRVFSEGEIVALTHAIISINGFNRLAIAFRQPVDEPRPSVRAAAR